MGCGASKPAVKDQDEAKSGEVGQPAPVSGVPAHPSANSGGNDSQTRAAASFQHSVSKNLVVSPDELQSYQNSAADDEAAELQMALDNYQGAPLPLNEEKRLAYLKNLNVLDTDPESRFDDITSLCCMIFKVPICLVSLVVDDRQWFKSVQGLGACSTDRKSSFCAWTLLPQYPEALVVEDAYEDARFKYNPLVQGDPFIRFYAGAPLVANNGMRLGSLCIIDRKPRSFDAESCNVLANMAEMVVREIEKRQKLQDQLAYSNMLGEESTQLLRAIDAFSEGIMLVNTSEQGWPVMFVNEAWEQVTGYPRNEGVGKPFWDLFKREDSSRTNWADAVASLEAFEMGVYFVPLGGGGARRYVQISFRSAGTDQMDMYMPLIGIPNDLPNNSNGPVYYFATFRGSTAGSALTSRDAPPLGFKTLPKPDPFPDIKLGPLLGKGAFGRVYRGNWNGAQVAVKVLEHSDQLDHSTQDGMLVEALLSDQLTHPNIVQSYKYATREVESAQGGGGNGSEDGKTSLETWLVLEFCNKGSIADGIDRGWFRKRRALFEPNLEAILVTAKEVAGAMCYLHNRGILHGDLTANNILLTASDKDERAFTAKVSDFGLAHIQAEGVDSVQTGDYGTITHMPPELLLDGTLTKSTDVYSFGVVLWEMCSGQRPYAGQSHAQIIHSITSGKTLDLSLSTPQPLREFLRSCMAFDPEERPSFESILDTLEELEDQLCM